MIFSSRPMVETKYPLAHSDCLSYIPFARFIFFLSQAEDFPFSICIMYEMESLGIASKHKCI